MIFKKDDIVICYDNEGYRKSLTVGKTYKILYLNRADDSLIIHEDEEMITRHRKSGGIFFTMKDDEGYLINPYACRFVLFEMKLNRKLLK